MAKSARRAPLEELHGPHQGDVSLPSVLLLRQRSQLPFRHARELVDDLASIA